MEININLLKDLVDAIGAAGDAIAKIAEGIKHLVTTGTEGYDAVRARRAYAHLRDLSARCTILIDYQIPVTQTLAEYAELSREIPPAARARAWIDVSERIADTLDSVVDLLNEVRNDRSDFVLEPAYAQLQRVLSERIPLLESLQTMPPRSPASSYRSCVMPLSVTLP